MGIIEGDILWENGDIASHEICEIHVPYRSDQIHSFGSLAALLSF